MRLGEAERWTDPTRPGDMICIYQGHPGAQTAQHRGPYVKVTRNGRITRVPLEGNPTLEEAVSDTEESKVATSEPEYSDFKRDVLQLATEAMSGVYEAWWDANTWYPDLPASERLRYAERAIRELLAENLIRLYRGTWDTAEDHPIPEEETDSVLRSFEAWCLQGEPTIFFAATPEGQQYY